MGGFAKRFCHASALRWTLMLMWMIDEWAPLVSDMSFSHRQVVPTYHPLPPAPHRPASPTDAATPSGRGSGDVDAPCPAPSRISSSDITFMARPTPSRISRLWVYMSAHGRRAASMSRPPPNQPILPWPFVPTPRHQPSSATLPRCCLCHAVPSPCYARVVPASLAHSPCLLSLFVASMEDGDG
jgi:hypothetical protein